jgi:hypothetical protein
MDAVEESYSRFKATAGQNLRQASLKYGWDVSTVREDYAKAYLLACTKQGH